MSPGNSRCSIQEFKYSILKIKAARKLAISDRSILFLWGPDHCPCPFVASNMSVNNGLLAPNSTRTLLFFCRCSVSLQVTVFATGFEHHYSASSTVNRLPLPATDLCTLHWRLGGRETETQRNWASVTSQCQNKLTNHMYFTWWKVCQETCKHHTHDTLKQSPIGT